MQGRADNGVDPVRRTMLGLAVVAPAMTVGAASVRVTAQVRAVSADLAQAVEAYNRATVTNDVAALARLVTDDYMLVNSDTTVQGKQSYLDDFSIPGFRVDPYVMEQPFEKMWRDTALTGGLFQLSWTQDGERHSRRLRVAHVWTRQDGRWRIAYTQLTRVPEQQG